MTKQASVRSGEGPATAKLLVNPAGFAFAEPLDGGDSVYIPRGRLGVAVDGDEVAIRSWASDKGFEGEIVEIVRRGRTRLTGVPRQLGRAWVLEPDDPRVLWRPEIVDARDMPDGLVVVASIERWPSEAKDVMLVRVDRVLGPPDTLGTEQLKILIERGINPEFPADVLAEAERVPRQVQPEDLEGRADLRALEFMTIDPVDARDFDDAVCVELLGGDIQQDDMRLHVAVADVSHYVREGAAVDREAALRCFSAYLPDRAIPMLPHALSSHMCSLVPDQDRLAMVVSMRLGADGEAREVVVRAAVIHSRRRLTYEQVAAELTPESEGSGKLTEVERGRIALLRRAADRLRAVRLHHGAVELSLPETKVILDQDDPSRIRDIVPARASKPLERAYNLIEELMVAANEATGRIAVAAKLPMVFRVHDLPDPDRLQQLAVAADALGVDVDPEKLRTSRGVQKFLGRVATHARAQALNMFVLRAMAQAQYRTDNVGHFALASEAYVHFTSPIRRYPDLVAHRVLKAHLRRTGGQAGPEPVPAMPELEASQAQAARSSLRERATADAERDSKALFAAAYMRDRLGDRFEATITGFGSAGVYVTIERPFVDGMIRLAVLERERGEQYELEGNGVRMVGKRSGHALVVGDRLVVEATDASLQRRKVDFAYVTRLATGSP